MKTRKKTKKALLKVENEAAELFAKVTSFSLDTKFEKVGWILNHYPAARNSDITCLIKYWETFEPEAIEGEYISLKNLYKYTRLTTVSRARAKIQNDYKLFLASLEVQKQRGVLEEESESWAITEQPDFPIYTVFIDESGKTGKTLLLGSMWIIDHMSSMQIANKIMDLRTTSNFHEEIHFQNINAGKLDIYRKILEILYTHSSTIGFKYIAVQREGIGDVVGTLEKMLVYLLIDGIKHENETGRAPLPRNLQVIKDRENIDRDKITLREAKIKLESVKESIFSNKIHLDEFKAISSKDT